MSSTAYRASRTRTVVAVGVFAALAYVAVVLFHFKASFLTFDLKDAVMAIGAMLFGPLYGLAMSLIVALLEAITISSTGIYGFVMNVLSSVTFVCLGSLIYSRRRTLTGAVVGMLVSVFGTTAVMMGANLLITPYYMGVSAGDVAAMIPTLLLPFNLTKAVFNASLVFLLYKPIAGALKAAGFVSGSSSGSSSAVGSGRKKRFPVSPAVVIALIFAAAALAYFFLVLKGSFSIG